MPTLGPSFVLGRPLNLSGRAHPLGAFGRVASPLGETFPNLLPANAAAFDTGDGWAVGGNWSVSAGVARNAGASTSEILEYNLDIPAGDMLVSFRMTKSNVTSGVVVQFGGGFYNINETRRDLGQHAWLVPSAGHTRLRLVARNGWAGALDDVSIVDVSNVQSRPADIYLLAGQSNMAGNSAMPVSPGLDVGDPRITYLASFGSTRFGGDTTALRPAVEPLQHFGQVVGVGPGLSAAKGLLPTIGTTRRIVLVAAAQGGTGLVGAGADWEPGVGGCYLNLVAQARSALALCPPGSKIKGLFWSQGETDNSINVGDTYPPAFQSLLAALRTDLSLPSLPTVILGPTPEADTDGRLATTQAKLDENSGDSTAIPGVRFVAGPAGQTMPGDDIHFNPAGNRARGSAGAAAMRTLLAKESSAPVSDQTSSALTFNGSHLMFDGAALTIQSA